MTTTRVAHGPSTRATVGLAAVLLCALVLAWRLRTIAREPRVWVAPRVAQLMYDRLLAQQIEDYARRYRRPAYFLDSVVAHLDSADAAAFRSRMTDLWGDPIGYLWSYCGFSLRSDGGTRRWPGNGVVEEYSWPRGVGRTRDCHESF